MVSSKTPVDAVRQAVVDAVLWPAVLLSNTGQIIAFNEHWARHHKARAGDNYPSTVDDDSQVSDALRGVLQGEVSQAECEVRGALGWYRVIAVAMPPGALVFHAATEQPPVGVTPATFVRAAFDFDRASRIVLSSDGTVLAINRTAQEQALRVMGKVPSVGDSCWPFVNPPNVAAMREGLTRGWGGASFEYERRIDWATGSRWYEMRFEPVLNEAGEVIAVQYGALDITERKNAELAARANEQLAVLQRFANNIPAMLGYWNRELICEFANSAYQVWFGRKPEDIIGRPIQELLGPVFELNQPYIEGALQGRAQRFERELKDPLGGPPRISQATYTPDVEDGQVKGFFVLVTDITELRALEVELRQLQKLEAVGQLASGIAHDFNNLLTVVIAAAQAVQGSLPPTSSVQEDIEEILLAAHRAATLTQRLLAFGRKEFVAPKVVDLGTVVHEFAAMFRRLVRENIRIELNTTSSGRVRADPVQLEQLVMNLVVNARDAMPSGGSLTLTTGITQLDHDPTLAPGPYVTLTVQDTGCGMSEATLRRIFEPFFTTKPLGAGAGLGLSTVYAIARRGGGVVRVHSVLEQGSTFTVYLPKVDVDLTPAMTPPAALTTPGGGETVLVVEDEPAILRLAARALSLSGYRVLTASDGEQALLVLSQQATPIDVLLTDVVMPNMGGTELARHVHEAVPRVGVVFTSGYSDDTNLRAALVKGEAEFLAKPYSADQLREKVRRVLSRRAS